MPTGDLKDLQTMQAEINLNTHRNKSGNENKKMAKEYQNARQQSYEDYEGTEQPYFRLFFSYILRFIQWDYHRVRFIFNFPLLSYMPDTICTETKGN